MKNLLNEISKEENNEKISLEEFSTKYLNNDEYAALNEIKKIKKHKKVFVLGMGKTGTTSIELLLEGAGYRVCKGNYRNAHTNFLCACYYYDDINEILKITKYFDAFVDTPWCGTEIYKELVKIYPEAYYIHTTRDTDKWYKSFLYMYLRYNNDPSTTMETMKALGAYSNPLFFKKAIGIESLENNEEKIKNWFINYNNEITKFFENSPYNFLSLDITNDKDALSKTASFLNNEHMLTLEIPHLHKGNYEVYKTDGSSINAIYDNIEKYLIDSNFQERIDELAKKYENNKIIVYAAGIAFDVIREKFDLSKLNIIGIADIRFNTDEKPEGYEEYKTYNSYTFLKEKPDIVLIGNFNGKNVENFFKKVLIPKFGDFKYEPMIV